MDPFDIVNITSNFSNINLSFVPCMSVTAHVRTYRPLWSCAQLAVWLLGLLPLCPCPQLPVWLLASRSVAALALRSASCLASRSVLFLLIPLSGFILLFLLKKVFLLAVVDDFCCLFFCYWRCWCFLLLFLLLLLFLVFFFVFTFVSVVTVVLFLFCCGLFFL